LLDEIGYVPSLRLAGVIAVWWPLRITVTAGIEREHMMFLCQVLRHIVPTVRSLGNAVEAYQGRQSLGPPIEIPKAQARAQKRSFLWASNHRLARGVPGARRRTLSALALAPLRGPLLAIRHEKYLLYARRRDCFAKARQQVALHKVHLLHPSRASHGNG